MIENSFEVFLKTPTYDSKKEQLNQHLKSLHQIMEKDLEVIELQGLLGKIGGKFKRTDSLQDSHIPNAGLCNPINFHDVQK